MSKRAGLVLFGCFTTARYPEFLNVLKKRGLSILAVDEQNAASDLLMSIRNSDPHHPLRQLDEIFYTQPEAYDEIMDQVAAWAGTYEIRGVYCIKELFVEAAALAADYLGLPSPGLRAARVCRNKHLQRLYLKEWAPASLCVPPAARNAISESFDGFPAVLKPVARHSSSGVRLVTDRQTLCASLKEYPPHEVLLLEERIHGAEYSVESMVQNGRILFTNVTQKSTNESETIYFTETSHTLPAANLSPEHTRRLLEANAQILAKLAFLNGVTHGEYRVKADGRVYLMEMAARNPGDGIMPLYLLATGYLFEEEAIKIALGEEAAYPAPTRYARQIYLPHSPGRLAGVTIAEGSPMPSPHWFIEKGVRAPLAPGRRDDPPTVREINILRQRGALLGDMADSFARSVWVLLDAATPMELDALEAEVRRRVSVMVQAVE